MPQTRLVPGGILGLVRRWLSTWLPAVDVLAAAVAVTGAAAFRELSPAHEAVGAAAVTVLVVQPFCNAQLRLNRRLWAYATPSEYGEVLFAVAAGTVAAALLYYGLLSSWLNVTGTLTLAFWVLIGVLNLVLMGGGRFAIRLLAELEQAMTQHPTATAVPTLLYGAGEAGVMLARSARSEPRAGIAPVGFLDDDISMHGRVVARLPVLGGLDELEDAVAATNARRLVISMPAADGERVRQIVNAAEEAGLEVRTVPTLHELFDETVNAFRIRNIRVEDLLRRPVVAERASNIEALIRHRTVLITGAGGSIGSELARQVFAMSPSRLVLVDRAEGQLFAIQQELDYLATRRPASGDVVCHLANVASRGVMARLMRNESPSIVFHAAAYKHVPMMEDHPSDAVQVNIGGTMSVLDAALAAGVERFVFVSTDKAVEPTSVMGATKRVGESLVASAGIASQRPYVSVRFGNVLGSSGSVVPIFKQQLEDGKPLTITHPEMTRYFMTIPEAVWLILDAAAFGRAGDLFVLDMGKPVRILDLAKDLIRLSGRDASSVPIEFVGLRAGEKLSESLFYEREEVTPTANPKVLLTGSGASSLDPRARVGALLLMATGTEDAALRSELFDLVEQLGRPALVPAQLADELADESMAPRAVAPAT